MALVIRLGPLPLGGRHASRVAELERIFGTAVEVVEVIDVAQLARAIAAHEVAAVALDVPGPEDLADAMGPSRRSFVRHHFTVHDVLLILTYRHSLPSAHGGAV